ncbi:MAG: Gfo/Idh/MocA family oxidoreductase [Planctomycetota bacterium]|nr:Gfo/Idh/MocA family oxidoreductase [Planctomycetota bacterium]
MSERKRYVVAGTGGRGIHMFAKPLLKEYTQYCELTGLYDINPLRMKAANELLGANVPIFTDFQEMLDKARPDCVVIASRDCTHAELIVKTLAAGKRALSEKPLCTTAQQCRDILAAKKKYARNGGACFVTHNCRYAPAIAELKRLLKEGVIGEVRAVTFQETLDRRHGADYFRRWHRRQENSGGLLLQKSSHHFDALNWLIGSLPDTLTAQGALQFYGKNGPFRHTRCEGCPHAQKCDFYADMWKDATNRRIYKDAESADGYIRDGCVFDNEVNIVDNAGVLYTYQNGVQVTYSLIAYASYEGWLIQFEGTKGRLELKEVCNSNWAPGTILIHGLEQAVGQSLMLFSPKDGMKQLPIPEKAGGHGGADSGIQFDWFGRPFDAPLTEQQAPVEQAVQAVLIGHAANVSMANGSKPVKVQELLKRG